MSEIAINIDRLWKQYRVGKPKSTSFRDSLSDMFKRSSSETFWALKDISFEVKKGEAIGIIGKNGAGKSTLLKVLSKITYPTKGKIEMEGRVSSLLEVGTGFHPELTGRQNVYLNGTILGMTRREIATKFDEIVAFSGIEKFIDTPVKHYSSGMKVRLAFSVAAHLEPEILIIDEVLAVGDAEFQKKCMGKMETVAGEGRTVLFVSHNLAAIEQLCRKAIYLKNAGVEAEGDTSNILQIYNQDVHGNLRTTSGTKYLIDNENSFLQLKEVLLKVNHLEQNTIRPGDKLEVIINLVNKTNKPLKVGFVIKDYIHKTPIIGINNFNLGEAFIENIGGSYGFELQDFPLYRKGKYWIDLYFGNANEEFLILEDIISIEVINKNIYEGPMPLSDKLNQFYLSNFKYINGDV